jgi:ADP-heptose:LPS heptosyltransferase
LVRIRSNSYDYAFLFFPGWINSLFYFFCKSNNKAGFPNKRYISKWDNKPAAVFNNTFRRNINWIPGMNYIERIVLALESLEVKVNGISKPMFNSLPTEEISFKEYILIHFLSREKNRSLLTSAVTEIVNLFPDYHIIIISGAEDKNTMNIFPDKTLIINPSIAKLVTLIVNAKLFIGVDSFPIHIADAYNTNFVGIFGPTNPHSVLINYQKSIYFNCESLAEIEPGLIIKKIKNYITSINENNSYRGFRYTSPFLNRK